MLDSVVTRFICFHNQCLALGELLQFNQSLINTQLSILVTIFPFRKLGNSAKYNS